MKRGSSGRYETTTVGGEAIRAFIPYPLPPRPALELSDVRYRLLDRAMLELGRLDSVSLLLPAPELFLYTYVRREAVLSSQIEGTQSSLSDLLLFELEESGGVPLNDVVEVSNYVAALEHGLKRMQEGFPLSNRLIREMHAELLSRGRGSDKSPGEFRRTQNWIGGTRPGNAYFIPAPPSHVEDCMGLWSVFCMMILRSTLCLSKPLWLMCSLKLFILSLTGTVESVVCLLPLFCTMTVPFPGRCCI